MNSVSLILTEREIPAEHVVALSQEEYYPIIVAQISYVEPVGEIASVTRFRFTEQEKKAISEGADLILSQPHHGPMMPVGLQLAFPNEYPLELK